MDQKQGLSSSPPDSSMRRKRGRPRKDENSVHEESVTTTPGPDILKKSKQSMGTSKVGDELVGQVFNGIVEGHFDGGCLMKVKIGDTQMRGVVFHPGMVAPITPASDIAPDIKMVTRKDLPIPAVDSHLYRSTSVCEVKKEIPAVPIGVKKEIPAVPIRVKKEISAVPVGVNKEIHAVPIGVKKEIPAVPYRSGQSNRRPVEVKTEIPAVPYRSGQSNRQPVEVKTEIHAVPYRSGQSNRQPVEVKTEIPAVPYRSGQSNRHPVEVKKEIPSVPDQSQRCVPQSVIVESLKKQSSSAVIPPVGNLLKNDAGPSLGGKVMPQQCMKAEFDSQSAPVMVKPEHEVVEEDKVLEEVEKTAIMEGPTGAEFEKALKTETSSESFAEIQGNETVCNDPQIQPQAVGSERYYLVQDEVKSLSCELNQTNVFAEAAPAVAIRPGVETVCKDFQIQPLAVDSEKNALVHDEVKTLNLGFNQTPLFAEPAPISVISGIEAVCKNLQIQPQSVGSEKSAFSPDEHNPFIDPAGKSVENLMEKQAYSAAKPDQMFWGETVPAEGSIPSGILEPHITSSSCAVDNLEGGI